MKYWLVLIPALIFALLLSSSYRTENCTDEEIVNAIWKAEGGNKATYLYGIRSVKYDSPKEARKICFNTVRNNHKRFADYGYKKYDTYLEFLQSRYAPLNATNDPKGLNSNWLRLVRYFLKEVK